MHKTFGSYEYSRSRPHFENSETNPRLYLDYNEYYGNVHPETQLKYQESAHLLTSYFRPGDFSLENQLAQVYRTPDIRFHLVSGADHALEEILSYCKNHLELKTFFSYHQTTYDHFYTFTQKLGLKTLELVSADIVYVCCPNNPDGKIISALDCAKLVSLYPQKIFLFDFSYLAYSLKSYSSYLNILKSYPNVFFLSSLAKIYPIAGLRAGWFSTTNTQANIYFDKFLNAKMINPIARKILKSCLAREHFYKEETREIFQNRVKMARMVINFLEEKEITSVPKYDIECSGGNFFSLYFEHAVDLQKAILLLEKKHLFVRHKSHWDFIRITSVNDQWLSKIQERFK